MDDKKPMKRSKMYSSKILVALSDYDKGRLEQVAKRYSLPLATWARMVLIHEASKELED